MIIRRRDFLRAACTTAAALGTGAARSADDFPPVTEPRATDGDERFEPDWNERLTITVGPDKADLVGTAIASSRPPSTTPPE